MEILRSPGNFKIVSIMAGLNSESPIQLIESAGRIAYQSQAKITEGSAEKFVSMLIRLGHKSVIEHSCMSVRFSDISRGFTHELVRHRLIAVTQESTRYVKETNLRVVCPPNKDTDKKLVKLTLPNGDSLKVSVADWFGLNEQMYGGLIEAGWHQEDARQVLPIGVVSQIQITTNFREWRHIFEVRCSPDAHWEIRLTMVKLLKMVQGLVPKVFDDFVIKDDFSSAKIVR